MSGELLPCPFCGEEPIATEFWPSWDTTEQQVNCYDGCGAQITRKHRKDAIAAWNTRAPLPPKDTTE